jgi:hypothetical protein
MLNRDPMREAPHPRRSSRWHAAAYPSLNSEGLAAFRRAYRWLNLTLIQHGIWPLLIVVVGAPPAPVGLTPPPWYWARVGAPLLAALLAVAYLAQRPAGVTSRAPLRRAETGGERGRLLREQVTVLVVGVTVAVAVLRLVQGPPVPVLKLIGFGIVNVAAFQAINFGVAGRGLGPDAARALPIVLFALSWGLQDLFLAASSPAGEQLAFTFAGGAVLGLAIGGVSWLLRRWPGGFLTSSAFHLLVVYLVLGFLP